MLQCHFEEVIEGNTTTANGGGVFGENSIHKSSDNGLMCRVLMPYKRSNVWKTICRCTVIYIAGSQISKKNYLKMTQSRHLNINEIYNHEVPSFIHK